MQLKDVDNFWHWKHLIISCLHASHKSFGLKRKISFLRKRSKLFLSVMTLTVWWGFLFLYEWYPRILHYIWYFSSMSPLIYCSPMYNSWVFLGVLFKMWSSDVVLFVSCFDWSVDDLDVDVQLLVVDPFLTEKKVFSKRSRSFYH